MTKYLGLYVRIIRVDSYLFNGWLVWTECSIKMFSILVIFTIFSCSMAENNCNEYNVGLDVNNLNQVIPDSAFSASSQATYGYRAARGRLNTIYERSSDKKGGWMATNTDTNPWINVDLQADMEVAGVITQGRQCGNNWVTEFRVEYKKSDCSSYHTINETFIGNTDRNTEVRNNFPTLITARNIRIHPEKWYGNAASLRFEVIGCRE
ncbi:probable carboxypeptidase X1 [Anneissia japonica]|uniref:probable carboxypeptidase X1 n=1 Tax=Anneissia japonica TaxID=1529436 RepID=UPI0014256057|nr:probable carboxypeptidase X1 [Anneissia japonica]XP_033127057.1 probable carboxypeptidase X1 [Anneissia japonica]